MGQSSSASVSRRPAPRLGAFLDRYVGFTVRDPEGNLWSFGTYGGE